MSQKTVSFKHPAALPKPAEDWIGEGGSQTRKTKDLPSGPTKRLTVDISEDLHRRIKVHCAEQGTQIADVVRQLLVTEFPGP